MLIADQIFTSLVNAKLYATYLSAQIESKRVYGENLDISNQKFILLSQWTRILQGYYDNLDNGNIPEESCFTFDEISELMAKIKAMIGNTKLEPVTDWLLQTGFWNDNGFWRDDHTWNDNVIFI